MTIEYVFDLGEGGPPHEGDEDQQYVSFDGAGHLLGLVYRLPADYRSQHLCLEDLRRSDFSDVAIEHYEVRQHAGSKSAFVMVAEIGKCRTSGVGGDCLVDGELLLRVVLL